MQWDLFELSRDMLIAGLKSNEATQSKRSVTPVRARTRRLPLILKSRFAFIPD